MRGTFANIRLRNQLAPGTEGGVTVYLGPPTTPTADGGEAPAGGEQMSIYDAAMRYAEEGVPLVVLGRQGVRLGLLARLGRQGHQAARREGRDRRELRAHPPLQPDRDGRAAIAIPRGRVGGVAWGSTRTSTFEVIGLCRAVERRRAAQDLHGEGRRRRVRGDREDRHAQGGRLLQARRHPPVRACDSCSRREPAGALRLNSGPAGECGSAGVSAPGSDGFTQTLRDLLAARGPSGYETAPAAVWSAAAEAFGAEVQTDVVGTPSAKVLSSGRIEASAPPRRLIVMGHIDEIGLIVTHIDDEGYLWFREVGGWDAQILVGQRVVIATRDGEIAGVIGKKPIHLLRDEERKKVAEVKDLHIDIGAKDGDQAREMVQGRRRGGDRRRSARVAQRADRLAGSGQPARLVRGARRPRVWSPRPAGASEWELVAVAAAQEETTFGGSRTSAFSLEPDAAIVVDVTHATDAPGIDVKESGKHELGSGPVLEPRLDAQPGALRAAVRDGRARENRLHRRGDRAQHGHRRRRGAPQPRRRADRARVDPPALHALAGRAGAAGGRARGRGIDRRDRAAGWTPRPRSRAEPHAQRRPSRGAPGGAPRERASVAGALHRGDRGALDGELGELDDLIEGAGACRRAQACADPRDRRTPCAWARGRRARTRPAPSRPARLRSRASPSP